MGPSAGPIRTTRSAMARHYRWNLNRLSRWCGPDALVDVYVVERAGSQDRLDDACLALFVVVSKQPEADIAQQCERDQIHQSG